MCACAFAMLALACASCVRAPAGSNLSRSLSSPPADSATVLLWRMDETLGAQVNDAGPQRLDGLAGRDARTDFGRFGSARVFSASVQSFLYAPYDDARTGGDGFTVEAWIYVGELGLHEGGPLAARWTQQANEQSWLFTLAGRKAYSYPGATPSPGYLAELVSCATTGHLVFALQPEQASAPLCYSSTREIELRRWTHVAATCDRELVRLYVDGQLDAQYEHRGGIRRSAAPLVVGNHLDPRWIDREGGIPAVVGGVSTPFYAFVGMIDELRISNVARTDFGHVTGR